MAGYKLKEQASDGRADKMPGAKKKTKKAKKSGAKMKAGQFVS